MLNYFKLLCMILRFCYLLLFVVILSCDSDTDVAPDLSDCYSDSGLSSGLVLHPDAAVIQIDSTSTYFQSLEVREYCLGEDCRFSNVTCNYSNPEFRFDLDSSGNWHSSYFIWFGWIFGIPDPEPFNSALLSSINNKADKFELLKACYGPEPSLQEPAGVDQQDIALKRYFRKGSGGLGLGPPYTLEELEFRIVRNDTIVLYFHYLE